MIDSIRPRNTASRRPRLQVPGPAEPAEPASPQPQATILSASSANEMPTSGLQRYKWWFIGSGTAIILAASVASWAVWLRPDSCPDGGCKNIAVKSSPTPTPTPTTKLAPLTGLAVSPAIADRPIVSVIIENHPDARPQSGLSFAGVVYEALAEGGITRFQAFFGDQSATSIGPVRSLRPYFVDWALEFNAPVAHAGGSQTALDLARATSLKSLNALTIGAPPFYRTRDRYAPHNLYTSSDLLTNLLNQRGYAAVPNFTPSPRSPEAPLKTPDHPTIGINYSSAGFKANYTYNAADNTYLRSLAGAPHIDRVTGKQIAVKNVVVEYMPTVTLADLHVQMTTVGQGKALVFKDGTVIAGTWSKPSRVARTKLLDAAGKEIPLNAGNTWYSIVPVGKTVTY